MIQIETSRTGFTIPLINGKALVSRFDPEREALRFIEKRISSSPETILILGDVLGYLGNAAGVLFPDAEILGITATAEIAGNKTPYTKQCCFDTGNAGEFLDTYITENNFSGLTILEWQPVFKAFPEFATGILRLIQRRLRILNGNITTTRGFGSRWLKNTVSNFLHIPRFTSLAAGTPGIALIAASGASLQRSEALLRGSAIPVIALPSSLRYLKSICRVPLLTVQTDPGYYAAYHLREGLNWSSCIAAPLSASPFISRTGASILSLNQGDAFEDLLLSQLGVPSYPMPSAGTVAATALSAAIAMGAEPAVMAGLDLCYEDIHTHVRPHSFDEVFAADSLRISPEYSAKFRYSRDTENSEGQSRALETYSQWFKGLNTSFTEKARQLNPSKIELPIQELSYSEITDYSGPLFSIQFGEEATPDFRRRQTILLNILEETDSDLQNNRRNPVAAEFILKTGNDAAAVHLVKECVDRVYKMERL